MAARVFEAAGKESQLKAVDDLLRKKFPTREIPASEKQGSPDLIRRDRSFPSVVETEK
jgi:hypothetical protein